MSEPNEYLPMESMPGNKPSFMDRKPFIKRGIFNISVLAGLSLVFLGSLFLNCRRGNEIEEPSRTVYSNFIGDAHVTYTENFRFSQYYDLKSKDGLANVMRISKGDKIFTLYDLENRTNLDPTLESQDNLKNDDLEAVRTEGVTCYSKDLEGAEQGVKDLFEQSNSSYDELRGVIWKIKRQKYVEGRKEESETAQGSAETLKDITDELKEGFKKKSEKDKPADNPETNLDSAA